MITYVTGCSGTGKGDLAGILRSQGAPVVELNEHPSGMPNAGHLDWLQWVAAEFLADAAAEKYEHRIVVGTMIPFRLIDSLSWREHEGVIPVRFVLIDRPWDEIKATLTARLVNAGAEDDEIAEQVENDRRLQRALHYQVDALAMGVLLDDDLDGIAEWVQDI